MVQPQKGWCLSVSRSDQQQRLNGHRRWSGVLPRVAWAAGRDDVGGRMRSALGQWLDVVLRQLAFTPLATIRAAVVERGLHRGPLGRCEVADRSSLPSGPTRFSKGANLVRVLLSPFAFSSSAALWVLGAVALSLQAQEFLRRILTTPVLSVCLTFIPVSISPSAASGQSRWVCLVLLPLSTVYLFCFLWIIHAPASGVFVMTLTIACAPLCYGHFHACFTDSRLAAVSDPT